MPGSYTHPSKKVQVGRETGTHRGMTLLGPGFPLGGYGKQTQDPEVVLYIFTVHVEHSGQ